MKRLLLISTCLFMAAPVFAQQASMQSPAYRECSALANSNPTQALAKADAWLKMDAGIAAQHCRAMALYGLRRFAEAADALTNVRAMIAPENITLRSYVARQASNALVGANSADQAIGLLSTQINEISTLRTDNGVAAGVTSELLVERARVNTNFGKLDEAARDLDHAVSLTPTHEAVLMERAGVFEKLGDLPLARNDLKSILIINSANSGARTGLSRLSGDAPMSYTAPSTSISGYAPAAPFAAPATAAAEQPVAKKPVTRAKKKKRVRKPVAAQPQAEPVMELENEPMPEVSAQPMAAPVMAMPAAQATPAMPTLPMTVPATPAPTVPAPKPAAAMPAMPVLPAAGLPGLPPLPTQ